VVKIGFFDSFLGKSKTKVPASGLYSQPQAYQDLYGSVAGNTAAGVNNINAQMFTPQGFNQGEQQALNQAYQGFTPTAGSINSDMSMLMNPFDDYVINDINRQSQGQNSLVNQAATQAGQQGSNRSFLGSSDVEQNRLNNIGTFRQGQYNTALDQILNTLTNSRRQDTAGALGAGALERDLGMQTQQAPLQALLAQQGLLGGIPTQFGNAGNTAQTVKTGANFGTILDNVGKIAALFG
jgi:hypothetical protein